jgi:hypothetical protein
MLTMMGPPSSGEPSQWAREWPTRKLGPLLLIPNSSPFPGCSLW